MSGPARAPIPYTGVIGTRTAHLKQGFATIFVYGQFMAGLHAGDVVGSRHDPFRAVREAVVARRAVDSRERASIAAFVEAFDALAEPFDEHASPTHVTASAIITGEAGVVLHLHKRLGDLAATRWAHRRRELPWEAARREAQEETGLDPTPVGGASAPAARRRASGPAWAHPPRPSLPLHRSTSDPAAARWREPRGQLVVVVGGHRHGRSRVSRACSGWCSRVCRPCGAAVIGDAPACARVYIRSKAFGLPEVPEPHTEAEVATWMAEQAIPEMDVWVADLDGVVVGQLMLAPGWLHHLYIDPSWMGRGLGDQFMALARQRQPDGLQLWAFQSNVRARRFYERHGFVAVEYTDGRGNEEHWPDVRYVG